VIARDNRVLVTPLDIGGRLDALAHRGSVVQLSDGRQRLYARVQRAWRRRRDSEETPFVRNKHIGNRHVFPGDLVRVEVSWPGGVTRSLSVFDRGNAWWIVGVMVAQSAMLTAPATTTDGAA